MLGWKIAEFPIYRDQEGSFQAAADCMFLPHTKGYVGVCVSFLITKKLHGLNPSKATLPMKEDKK